jgi:hypothetical protein
MSVEGSSMARLQPWFNGLLHNSLMASLSSLASLLPPSALLKGLLCSAWLLLAGLSPLQAQDSQAEADTDSTEAEESDEAYRRRMELEDARQRDLGYTLPAPTYAQKQEKLDKLPEESRDNIRDQLVDIIVENGEWEPSDALKEYPYEPTDAAQANPELMQQEQEAWDEQIEKYHKREAAAFGTYLGPVPGPGNPTGEEGGGQEGAEAGGSEQGSGQQSGGAGAQEGGQEGAQDAADSASSAGTYEPYQSNRSPSTEEVSTAGVQQSALDFIKGLQGKAQPPAAQPAAQAQAEASASADAQANPAATAESSQATADPQSAAESSEDNTDTADESEQKESADHTVEIDLTTPGIIRIEDIDKLQGTDRPTGSEGARQP